MRSNYIFEFLSVDSFPRFFLDLARLRESTLMNLMNVIEKLDEVQLQEKLVRCIVGLQNDTEPSIRTNATIFLGRIASKLKENVR